MPDFSNQTSANSLWIDDLLVKDLSGHLKAYHQTKNASNESPSVLSHDTVLEIAPSHELTVFNTAPHDSSFDFFHDGGQAHEPALFVFHPEDHQQIEDFRQNLPIDDSKKYSVEKIAQRIAEKHNLIFDKVNGDLFDSLLLDFFRNRKNYTITREYLLEKIISNGHNLSSQAVDHVGSIIKGIKERIDAEGGLVVRQSDITVPIVATQKDTAPKIIDDFKPTQVAPEPVLKKEIEVPKKIIEATQPIKVRVQTEEVPEIVEFDSAPSLPKVNRLGIPKNEKSTINDVVNKVNLAPERIKNTLTGPVEELANMSLNTFRRYGNTATDRTEKILQKINILEKDSVTKKTLGITAWRKSPIYKLYLELGSGSLMKGQEVSQMIAEQKMAGQEVLTIEEFQAISDLNKLLRF
jgi:hypothetical protein